MEDKNLEGARKWIEDLSKGKCHQLEALSLDALKIVQSQKGLLLCSLVVSNSMLDGNGNWHVGAMATLIDDVGAVAIYSLVGHFNVSLDFNISFYSTAKVQDGEGNWHIGAMATLIDKIAATVHSFAGQIKLTLDFGVSYYSTAKIQEEVEIEAKVVGEKGKLASVMIKIRRVDNGEVIASAKQWTASNNNTAGRGSEFWKSINNNNNNNATIPSKL